MRRWRRASCLLSNHPRHPPRSRPSPTSCRDRILAARILLRCFRGTTRPARSSKTPTHFNPPEDWVRTPRALDGLVPLRVVRPGAATACRPTQEVPVGRDAQATRRAVPTLGAVSLVLAARFGRRSFADQRLARRSIPVRGGLPLFRPPLGPVAPGVSSVAKEADAHDLQARAPSSRLRLR